MQGSTHTARQLLHDWDKLVLEHAYPHPHRILTAMLLSRDLDTCRRLLRGEAVPPETLNQRELFIARNRRLVRLDMTAIDQLEAA